jgi:hypothetical protein
MTNCNRSKFSCNREKKVAIGVGAFSIEKNAPRCIIAKHN